MENIERIKTKGKQEQDTPKQTKPQWRLSKLRKLDTGKGQPKTDDIPVLPKEEDADQEQVITKTDEFMEPPEDKLLIACLTETDNGHSDTDDIWINAKTNIAMKLAIEENMKKQELLVELQVPLEYHEFLDIFDENRANRFPDKRPWDHKIEMKEGFEPKSFKVYNLTPAEQMELDKFLKDNLDKGYIRPSQSPMASPFFFVDKKDRKLRPCQDYRYLNK